MLVGLALLLRWDRIGALVVVLGTVSFFSSIGVRNFPVLTLINLLPLACFAISRSLGPARAQAANSR
jgi:hypothetical protein